MHVCLMVRASMNVVAPRARVRVRARIRVNACVRMSPLVCVCVCASWVCVPREGVCTSVSVSVSARV